MKKRNSNKAADLIINDFIHVAYDRNRKDMATLKSAVESAESVYIPNRARLYDLYHDVLTLDAHLSGLLEKRTMAVINKSLMFVDGEGHKIQEMDRVINSEMFQRLIEVIMDSVYWGTSAVEFDLTQKDLFFYDLDKRHIRPEKRQIAKSQWDIEGTDIDSLPFCWLMGRPGDMGRLLQCSMYALYKRSGYGDFAQYVEIFGQPVRIVKYDAYDKQTQTELRKALDESGGSLVMMLPKQADFSMLDGKSSNGTGELHQRLIDCCNHEMSIAILGNTETTTSSTSSGYAQAAIHAGQQSEITAGDMRYVLRMLNSEFFINILASYGYNVSGGSFVYEKQKDLEQLRLRLDMDLQLASQVPFSDDYWYDTYGIPKPDNYEQIKKQKQQAKDDAMEKAAAADRKKQLADFFLKAPRTRGAMR